MMLNSKFHVLTNLEKNLIFALITVARPVHYFAFPLILNESLGSNAHVSSTTVDRYTIGS